MRIPKDLEVRFLVESRQDLQVRKIEGVTRRGWEDDFTTYGVTKQ
jgi:hypothetical protein